MKLLAFILPLLIVTNKVFPVNPEGLLMQPTDSIDYLREHQEEHHHKFEIGLGTGWVSIIGENEHVVGFHFHLLGSIWENPNLSIGPGIEYVAGDHDHLSALLSFGYRPIHPLYFGISPGLSISLTGEENKGMDFTMHFESLYEFEFEHFHIGPMLEYSLGQDESHLMLAVHFGFHF